MNKSESIKELACALAKAQGEIENASKSSANPHFKSRYADLAEILNTVRPVLAKHGLSVAQFPTLEGSTASVETILMHASGEWLSSIASSPMQKMDAQGVGSVTTYLRRYSPMVRFYDVEQNTPEWLQLRAGRITSSSLGKVMANYGKAFGDPAKAYAVSICIERMTGKPVSNGFSNEHTERGHEQEPDARMAYAAETFCDISNGGFFEVDDLGCSPDGLVYQDGIIEIKSVIPSVHFANLKRQSIDPTYKWQLFGNLKMTGRDWIDFISYCADFPEGMRLYTCRTYAKTLVEEFKQIDTRLDEFRKLIDETMKTIQESNYSIIESIAA
jgi:hypothetical protein